MGCGRRSGRRCCRRGRRSQQRRGGLDARRNRRRGRHDDGPHRLLHRLRARRGSLRRAREIGRAGDELTACGRHCECPTEQSRDAVLKHGELRVVEMLATLDQREQRGEGGRGLHDHRRALRRGPLRIEHRSANLSRLRLALEQRGEVRVVHVVDGHDAVQDHEDAPSRLGQCRAPGLVRGRLRQRPDHGLERLEAIDRGGCRGRDTEGARRVEDARAQVDELAARGGELLEQRIGGQCACPLELARRLGELRRQSCEPSAQRGEVLDEIVRRRRHGMLPILGVRQGGVKPAGPGRGVEGRYSVVTRSTSSSVVTPSSTFSRPASRSVFMPCFAATSLISLTKVLARMRPRISGVAARTS